MNDTNETAAGLDLLEGLVQRAQQGDRSVLPQLRHVLDTDPSVWQECGDLALQAQEAWLRLLAGSDLLLHESVQRKMEALRAELSGPVPSPLEKLLVERVVACWLQTHYADALYAQAKGPEATHGTLRELMLRQESAQKRYLAAIKQLAVIRKLMRPSISPVELATRTVEEGRPAARSKGRPERISRVATAN